MAVSTWCSWPTAWRPRQRPGCAQPHCHALRCPVRAADPPVGSRRRHRADRFVATASTSYNEPYHIARKFASLDQIIGGRAGWNLVTSSNPAEALNFNRDAHLLHADRYDRAEEFVDVVRGLWNSWEDGAFPRDRESGQFLDPARMHVLDHRARHFRVRGPLNVDRSPQGQPVIVQAGRIGSRASNSPPARRRRRSSPRRSP
ncbi:MAG: LLM class flavin-dependent oxidoreductase [Acetobacteraceae bacterium]